MITQFDVAHGFISVDKSGYKNVVFVLLEGLLLEYAEMEMINSEYLMQTVLCASIKFCILGTKCGAYVTC